MARSLWSRIPKSLLVIGVAAAAVLLYLAASWYWVPASSSSSPPSLTPPPTGTTVQVVDVDFISDYSTGSSSDSHYLTTAYCYASTNPGCAAASSNGYLLLPDCPSGGCANVTPGTSFSYDLTLVDNDTASHQIINITIGAPLTLLGLSPTVPCTLSPGTPTTFSITVGTPDSPGEYDLAGVVETS